MSLVPVENLKVGDYIRFRIKDPHDNVLYMGKVAAICDYEMAIMYADVATTYQNILRVDNTLDAKEAIDYLVVLVEENGDSTKQTRKVFGFDWITASTLELINEDSHVDIRVYNITDDKALELKNYIASLGYTTTIVATE